MDTSLSILPDFASFFATKKGAAVEVPCACSAIAESHTHLSSLHHIDPGYALARNACAGVDFVVDIVDPTEEGRDFDALLRDLQDWQLSCKEYLDAWSSQGVCDVLGHALEPPCVRFTVGCHPHNAKDFDEQAHESMQELLAHPMCCGIGEIGLDYHYDYSPRDVQRAVFAEQLELACDLNAPVSLHIREAHADAAPLMQRVGVPSAGAVLHCFDLGFDDAAPFLEMGCYLGIGGAVTFKRNDATREAVCRAPRGCVLLETDAPYMAPEPLRGTRCEPAYIAITARFVADLLEQAQICTAEDFYREAHDACRTVFDRPAPYGLRP